MARKISLQIKRINNTLVEGVSKRIGEMAFAGFSAIVIASPVDTGHFRHNWQPSIGVRKTNELEGFDKPGQITIAKSKPLFASYEMGTEPGTSKIIFSNNVPYALRLNEGHSPDQAPAGFVQKALRAAIKALDIGGKVI